MKLHQNKELFAQAITTTAQQKGLKESFIEKDYWVTLALHKLYSHEISNNLVFKGGTSLAKCYDVIKRFSEDIDLVLLDVDTLSGNQKKTMLKKVSDVINNILPEIPLEGITHKTGQIRKTAHEFPIIFENKNEQTRNEIVLEVNWLGDPDPYNEVEIFSYIYEMMLNAQQIELIETYEMKPFYVKAMDLKRTFCEKIMSLVRFSYKENPIEELKNKIRHAYDLHQLIQNKEINKFIDTEKFQLMMLKVATNDLEAYKESRDCLKIHPKEAKIFKELDEVWDKLKNTYNTSFKYLVYADLPNEEEIYKTMKLIKDKINNISWLKTENQ